jgi:hypothetical protein
MENKSLETEASLTAELFITKEECEALKAECLEKDQKVYSLTEEASQINE